MKKRIIALIIVITMIMPITRALALHENQTKSITNQANLASDVYIEGLYDNSTLYIGAHIKPKAYVDSNATEKNIEWQVTGNNGIIDFTSTEGTASILAKSQGKVWVMAKATDGSYRAREYAVDVKPYPNDVESQALIDEGITPILKRPLNGSNSILRVEVSKTASSKASTLEKYLRKLSLLGSLRNQKVYSDDYYEYFIINANSKNIEVRIDKKDSSYNAQKNILSDVSKYNGGTTTPPPVINDGNGTTNEGGNTVVYKPTTEEENKVVHPQTNEGNTSTNDATKVPSNENNTPPNKETPKGEDNIVILGGTGESKEDPIIIKVNENIKNKVEILKSFMTSLRSSREISFIRKEDRENYNCYMFKVSKALENIIDDLSLSKITKKNNFFIEIRVDKNDKESYEPLIEMLDDEAETSNKTVLAKNKDEVIGEGASEKVENHRNVHLPLFGLTVFLMATIAFIIKIKYKGFFKK
ncbi:MAG: hypothetical protein ACRC7N_16830 [Clostridium sp.]